jgi:hypothetical protein
VERLYWKKKPDGKSWDFYEVDLSSEKLKGVYIIWYRDPKLHVVRVGQGDVTDRVYKHRVNPEIEKYKSKGLKISWASVPLKYQRNGIEHYLYQKLEPIVGERTPAKEVIECNLPWT